MEDKIKQAEKVLGEPVASDFTDYVRKIRNNLIFLSVVSIGICLANLTISTDSTFLGLKFIGLQNQNIIKALFLLNAYFLIHFIWCSIDHLLEWRLRVTGTRVAFITAATYTSELGDYPTDPRQTSLYHWWKNEAKKINSFTEPLDSIHTKLTDWEKKVNAALGSSVPELNNVIVPIRQVLEEITKLNDSIVAAEKILTSDRIPASLNRFDNWFSFFLRSQNLRWLIIELLMPIFVGLYSLLLLWHKL